MRKQALVWFCFTALAAGADKDKKPWSGRTSNDAVEIAASVVTEKDEIKQVIGSDLDGFVILVKVEVAPRDGKKLPVSRDDFTLKSDKDGQKSQPFAPSQIAGQGALVIGQTSAGGGTFMGNENGPVWGGIDGRPRRMGGDGGAVGNTSDPSLQTAVTGEQDKDKKEADPVLAKLKELVLSEKEAAEPLAGWLYFPLEGKHKPKDLELWYRGPAGRLNLRFKPQ